MRINFIRGDITEQAVDAVVNAANHSLLGRGALTGPSTARVARRSSPNASASEPSGIPTDCLAVARRIGNEFGLS